LKWLVQKDVSVIPRSSSAQHAKDNSDMALISFRALTGDEISSVSQCASVMLKNQDLEAPFVTFHNKHSDSVHIFWTYRKEEGEEKGEVQEFLVKDDLKPGEAFRTKTLPGHTFIAYDSSKKQGRALTVRASYGQTENFHVEL